jgi:hypothetical protein
MESFASLNTGSSKELFLPAGSESATAGNESAAVEIPDSNVSCLLAIVSHTGLLKPFAQQGSKNKMAKKYEYTVFNNDYSK